MRKIIIPIEVVSIEEAKKVLERERLLASRNGKRTLVAKGARRLRRLPHTRAGEPKGLRT
jgi:DNA-binding FadR family transcriptional regulator